MKIKNVVVIGSGTMGSGIAAHLCNANVPVTLLDLKAAYQGKIFVNSKAQKTDAYQLSKAILLSESSEFNAKPELEIYADDVKCSHGSTSTKFS